FRALGAQFRELEQNRTSLELKTMELQQTADALRKSERRLTEKSQLLETTLEHMDQGIMVVDTDRMVPLCNRRAVEIMGLPPELMAVQPHFDGATGGPPNHSTRFRRPQDMPDGRCGSCSLKTTRSISSSSRCCSARLPIKSM